MISIVKNEFLKLFKDKKIYIFTIISLIIGTVIAVGYRKSMYSVSNIDITNVFSIGLMFILPYWSIFTVSTIFTDEYKEGHMKLNFISPITRLEYLIGKIIFIFITLIMIAFINFIFLIILNFYFKSNVIDIKILEVLGMYLFSGIPLIAFSTIIIIPALLMNNGGNTIAIGIALLLFLQIGGFFVFKKYNEFNIVTFFELININSMGRVFIISFVYFIIGLGISNVILHFKEIKI